MPIPQLVLILVASFAGLSAQGPARPASQSADLFVGTWVLNLAKSTYEGAPAPKSGMRTFDYERDGLILCTAHSVSATGSTSFVHYLFALDGKEYEEVARGATQNRTPSFVAAKKIDDRNIDLEFKTGGKVTIWHSWTISEDGKTFTVKRKSTTAQGQPTYSVAVYEKQ